MCGIAGIVSVDGSPIPDGAVERMIATLQHRGPDDNFLWRVVLLRTRMDGT